MGLSGLAQGFTHGLELGHEWGNQAEEMQARKDQMANEAGWRESQATQATNYQNAEIKNRADTLQFMKDQAAKNGTPITDENGNVVGYQTGKGGIMKPIAPKEPDGAKGMDQIATAYDALDKANELGKAALGEGAPVSGLSAIPQEVAQMFPHIFATSPINKYNDQVKAAALRTLSATPHARLTKEGLSTEGETIGGSGESQTSGLEKINQRKIELASSNGITPTEVDAYRAARDARNKVQPPPGDGGTTPPAGYVLHQNNKTGERAYLNAQGQRW
jgi:hypothetical protein